MSLGKQRRQKVAPNLRRPHQAQRIPRSYRVAPEPPPPPHPNRPPWMGQHPTQVPLIFFDLETTGGNPHNSEVIEIACVKEVGGVEVGRFQTLVNPRRNIPRQVRAITGIDNDTVRHAPTIEKVIDEFLDFIGDGVMVSHGAINDFAFVVEYAKRLRGKEIKNFYVCTHLLVSNFMPNIPNKRLTGLAEYFGAPSPTAHRALADAETTQKVFWKLFAVCEKNGFHTMEDLFKLQADNATLNRLGSGLLARDAERLPTTPGIVYLFNASREVSYVSATSNIKRSLLNVTELCDEREFNRLLVDLTDFKFDRTSHFLGALLREKRELKRLHLPIDPRKYEARSAGFVQLLLPGDLAEWMAGDARERSVRRADKEKAEAFGPTGWLRVPDAVNEDFDWSEEAATHPGAAYFPSMKGGGHHGFVPIAKVEGPLPSGGVNFGDAERNLYAYQNWSPTEKDEHVVPVRKARRIAATVRTQKWQISRVPETNDVVRTGHLQQGLGWYFGPFEQPKLVRKHFEDLVTLFPYHDDTLAMEERAENLETIVRFLHGALPEERARLEKLAASPRLFFKPFLKKQVAERIRRLDLLAGFPFTLDARELPRSGLALISNNDTKDMDIMVVVKGRVRKESKLPQEQTDKLKSSRFFTRLCHPWHEELTEPWQPMLFTDDICTDIELMSFWLLRRKGEGEWVDFEALSPLYDTGLLD